jgi:hypothetical protein
LSSADGTARVRVPRGSTGLQLFVPGSFTLSPLIGTIQEGYGVRCDELRAIDARGARVKIVAPALVERSITWLDGADAPDPSVSWFAANPALEALAGYVEAFSTKSDESGATRVLEPVQDGELLRSYEETLVARRAAEEYRLTTPPVPEGGLRAGLDGAATAVPAPAPPKDYVYTWHARNDYDVRRPIAGAGGLVLSPGQNSLWAARASDHDVEHLVRMDSSIAGAFTEAPEYTLHETHIDVSALPSARWAVESYTQLVASDEVYFDVNDWVVLDREGKARTFGSATPDTATLQYAGAGLAAPRFDLELREDGTLAPLVEGQVIEVEFVDASGAPAPYVSFIARPWSPDDFFAQPRTSRAWSDGEGRAVVIAVVGEQQRLVVDLAPEEGLPGTMLLPVEGADGRLRYVVPELGRLEIDCVALVGGEPRSFGVQLAPAVESAKEFGERDDRSPKYFTGDDGKLVIEDVPVGRYVVDIRELRVLGTSTGELREVVVEKPAKR